MNEESKANRRRAVSCEPVERHSMPADLVSASWIGNLLDALEAIADDESVANVADEVLRTREHALRSLDAIVASLRLHPGFSDRLIDPLDLLASALADGNKHPILKSNAARRGRPGRTSRLDTNYRRNVIVAVRALEAAGLDSRKAYQEMAKLLEKAGHHGSVRRRQALGFSASTIEHWSDEASAGSIDAAEVTACMDKLFGSPRKEWPPSLARARRIALAISNDPMLKLMRQPPA